MSWTNAHKWCVANADETQPNFNKLLAFLEEDEDTDSISSCLHYAALGLSSSLSKFLLELGFSPDDENINGQTPLHYACANGQKDTIRLLLKHGADSSIQDDGMFSSKK